MGIKLDYRLAKERLREAVFLAKSGESVPEEWVKRTERVGEAPSVTYTPMLGTALLARATNANVDPLAIKESSGPHAYSARTLCHQVLVPASVEYGFDIRTTGREPLNNQPFFRYDRVDAMARVRAAATPALEHLIDCLKHIDTMAPDETLAALAAYLKVCFDRARVAGPADLGGAGQSLRSILNAAEIFVAEDAEGGKRAQALVAAALDMVYDRVRTRLVNDPSRHFPGDVQVLGTSNQAILAVEVRAKAVPITEIVQFGRDLAKSSISRGVVVALSQPATFDAADAVERARDDSGVLMTIIDSVDDLLLSAFRWSPRPLNELLSTFPNQMNKRLQELAVREGSVDRWAVLCREVELASAEASTDRT